jgi:hypothetical protein
LETFSYYHGNMKRCNKCKLDKKTCEFYKDSSKHDGLRTTCKTCVLSSRKDYVERVKAGRAGTRLKKHVKNYCPKCDQHLSDDNFYSDSTTRFGQSTWCKGCKKERIDKYMSDTPVYIRMAVLHQVPAERLENLIPECQACGGEEGLAWDHDHNCCPGKYSCGRCVRGLLCRSCNLALGYLKDSPDRLLSLVNYLRSV